MIIKNKKTKEIDEIQYNDFKNKYKKEITEAFESYKRTQLNKQYYTYNKNNLLEQDFFFNLQWNFNHFGMSNWYIERM